MASFATEFRAKIDGLLKSLADPNSFKQRAEALLDGIERLNGRPQIYERSTGYILNMASGNDLYPGITRKPFYERSGISWANTFEAAFETIRGELLALRGDSKFTKYAQPLNQEKQQIYDGMWNTFNFYHSDLSFDENCKLCPETTKLLASLPERSYPLPGIAKFSALSPGAHILPHGGTGNYQIRCHLGLVTNPDCEIRVGDQIRGWREGKCLLFDDSLEHEVWNCGVTTRVVLLFDFWHPELLPEEIENMKLFFELFRAGPGLPKWQKSQKQMEKVLDPDWWR